MYSECQNKSCCFYHPSLQVNYFNKVLCFLCSAVLCIYKVKPVSFTFSICQLSKGIWEGNGERIWMAFSHLEIRYFVLLSSPLQIYTTIFATITSGGWKYAAVSGMLHTRAASGISYELRELGPFLVSTACLTSLKHRDMKVTKEGHLNQHRPFWQAKLELTAKIAFLLRRGELKTHPQLLALYLQATCMLFVITLAISLHWAFGNRAFGLFISCTAN